MLKFAVLGASALVLALGVAAASAEPFNPVTGYNGSALVSSFGNNGSAVTPAFGAWPSATPNYGFSGSLNDNAGSDAGVGYNNWNAGNPILQQFHEAGAAGSAGSGR